MTILGVWTASYIIFVKPKQKLRGEYHMALIKLETGWIGMSIPID